MICTLSSPAVALSPAHAANARPIRSSFSWEIFHLPWWRRHSRAGNFPALRYINFCGNYGDPIYHPQFHEVIAHVRREGLKVRIETNGSYRPAAWWARTAQILSRADQVQFSIDGLEDTNHLYRVNARWPDILAAIKELRGRVYLVWKFIVFRQNQHQIETARERAQTLGFDDFRLIRSSRFEGRWRDASGLDPLKPDPQWIGGRKAISEQIATLRHG